MFVAERDRLVRELRKADRRDEAEQVKLLRKPTVSAWTINQLARQERREVDLLLDAGHRLREAQQRLLAGEDPGSLDEATRTQREALGNLHQTAGRILDEAGRMSESTLDRIVGTLRAAAVSDQGRELLARGRLTGDLEPTGFELLGPLAEEVAGQAPARRRQTASKRAAPRKPAGRERDRQEGDEQRRQQVRKRLEEARGRLREARAAAKAAEKDLRAAVRSTDKARRELADAEALMRQKEAAAARMQTAVERAEKDVREAEQRAG